MKQLLLVILLLFGAVGCAVNPVTGERRVNFMSEDWEREVGGQMYAPMRQAQGGDWILDPELTDYVQGVGERLAAHAVRPFDYEFHILNDSTPNAWALPGGKIVVHRGLLTELKSEAELAAVLGHEIVHADAAHGAQAQSRGVLTQLGSVAAMIALGTQVDSRQAQELGMLGVQLGAALVTTRYSRDAEREADEFGMKAMAAAGYDPYGAVELQQTFVEIAERSGRNSDWLSGLFASHPPSVERVENNLALARALGGGGERGEERYRQKIAYLERLSPAYEAHDRGRKALAEDDVRTARRLAREALDMEPEESRFHALLGDTYAAQRDYREAESQYSRAIDDNPGFFYNYLRRGQVRQELRDPRGAQSDLEHSLQLLPTAQAHLALGTLSQRSGNQQQALAHFQEAAKAQGSPAATAAHGELARMNPASYLQVGAALDANGNAAALVRNQSPVAMDNVQLRIEYISPQGQRGQTVQTVRTVAPGETATVPLRLGQFASTADLNQRLRVTLTGARAR